MAQVGTPRFYVSVLQWLKSLGKISIGDIYEIGATEQEALSLLDLNPAHTKVGDTPDDEYESIQFKTDDSIASYTHENKGFAMVLNHNFKSVDAKLKIVQEGSSCGTPGTDDIAVNANIDQSEITPSYDGWSLWTFDDINDLQTAGIIKLLVSDAAGGTSGASGSLRLGCLALGNYYDMPHSPDLNLTMTREYGGIKTLETKGGASLSNTFYRGSPAWDEAGAWELYTGTPANKNLARSGRRVWDLSFSYLQDSDMFPDSSSLGWEGSYDTAALASGNILLNDNNFYSQVIHKTQGNLPFIFQPDGGGGVAGQGNFNPDQFAICKFDSGFKFDQVANGVYNVKLKIREVW